MPAHLPLAAALHRRRGLAAERRLGAGGPSFAVSTQIQCGPHAIGGTRLARIHRVEPTSRHRAAECDFRQLIADADLDSPDEVEYTPASLIFRWQGPMVAVVVDLDEPDSL